MLKKIFFSLSFFIPFSLLAIPQSNIGKNGNTHCFRIDWWVPSNSSRSGMQEEGPKRFVKINGRALSFFTMPGSISYKPDGNAQSSTSEACFGPESIEVGNNTVEYTFHWGGDGDTRSIVRLIGPGYDREIFNVNRGGGEINHDETKTIKLSLREIDPASEQRIENLKREISKLREDLQKVRESGKQELEALQSKLETRVNEILNINIDQLSPEDVRDLEAELPGIQEFVKDLTTDYQTLKTKVQSEIQEQTNYFSNLQNQYGQELDSQIIENLDDLGVVTIEIPPLSNERIDDVPTPFEVEGNIYDKQADQIIALLKETFEKGDRQKFLRISKAWLENQAMVSKSLQIRAGIGNEELIVFRNSRDRVRKYISDFVDQYGFFKDSPIPTDIRRSIAVDIKEYSPRLSENLTDAFSTWKPGPLSAEQNLVLDTTKAAAESLKIARQLKNEVEKKQAVGTLENVLEGAADYAKAIGGLVVGFTPLGDFVDLCEAVTGKELCLPGGRDLSTTDRVLSAVGLIAGSGEFWRAVGISSSSRIVPKLIAEESDELAASIKKIHFESEFAKPFLKNLQELKPSRVAAVKKTEVTVFRGVSKEGIEKGFASWGISPFNVDAHHRFSGDGIGALYIATHTDTAAAEIAHYAELKRAAGEVVAETQILSKVVSLDGLLDLSDPVTVRKALGLDLSTLRTNDFYYVSQKIGTIAKQNGYKGIIFKSARTEIGENIVLFTDKIGVDVL